MARSKSPTGTPSMGKPSVTPEFGIKLLSGQISKGEELLGKQLIDRNDFHAWNNTTRNYIEKAFGGNHRNVENLDVLEADTTWGIAWSSSEWSRHFVEALQGKIAALNGYIEELKTEILIRQSSPSAGANIEREPSKKVFIVHGHNAGLKYELAHSLQNAGLDVTILHEQLEQGRTILEKLSDHASEAGFAVVLLTADDVGGEKGASPDSLQPRARQNVVFELGLFIGLLGRRRVCAVCETGVEFPSDLHGLARIERDSEGAWRHKIAKEIDGAGIEVDFSKL